MTVMLQRHLLLSSLAFVAVQAQQVGHFYPEIHPPLTWQQCSSHGRCTTRNGAVVIDAGSRWLHGVGGYADCMRNNNTWNARLCPDDIACAENCALDGADYTGDFGVSTSGSSVNLDLVTYSKRTGKKRVGSRLYLLEDESNYQVFKLLNQEFTFDVDVSNLPCGLNGALYFVRMQADGGRSDYPTNKAGAKYGTGYCDAQCPRYLHFIDGQGNVEGWRNGAGNLGTCCAEMDIWEANSISESLTPHPCNAPGPTLCQGNSCGGGCDSAGCDFNPYRMGNHSFYGPGEIIDTRHAFTVVTQFITDDSTSSGTLTEIKRFYVQNGKVIPQSNSDVPGVTGNSISDGFCTAQKTAFDNANTFASHGGMANMGAAMQEGMVLVFSLWDDSSAHMLWLDSIYPTNESASLPGVARGTCSTSSGVPSQIESQSPNSYVAFSNIKFGPINSTFNAR